MKMTKIDLSRRFLLDVTKDGAVCIRERGSGEVTGGLPVYSTDTREEAESLRVDHCHLARDGSGIYRLNRFSGDVEALVAVAEMFHAAHTRSAEPSRPSTT